MRPEKSKPTHSQIIGIIWLSIALLIAAGALFFSRHGGVTTSENDTTAASEEKLLTLREDSVYRSRRSTHIYSNKRHPKDHYTSTSKSYYSPDTTITTTPVARRQPLSIELNSADTITLQLLHGIGPAYARRIVRYRERLGGFTDTDQLLEVYGFTPELLAHIRPHLTLDTAAIQRIAINSIGLKQLIRHPYIEYHQARDIVALRQRGVSFHNADDLRAVPSMSDSTLRRILPYLDFGGQVPEN